MKLYVNGDSHSAGAEAVNTYCFAEDDSKHWRLGRAPHPDNLAVSYGKILADKLGADLICDAESAGGNDRILRTTWPHLTSVQGLPVLTKPDLIIIGWSTWEREEWYNNGVYYQVTASGTDSVPDELKQQYRDWVINQNETTRQQRLLYWHNKIYKLHNSLKELNINHLFFNTYSDFSAIRNKQILTNVAVPCPDEYNWDNCYIDPYNRDYTYYNWCINNGFKTVSPNSYHFSADAHAAWAEFLYQSYLTLLLTQNS